MESQEHSVAAVAREALAVENMLIRRGNPDMAGPRPQDYRNAERQIDALAAKGITLAGPDQVAVERSVLVTIDEALDIIDNPYHGEDELEAWADFFHAKDMLDLALYPTGKTADWLGLVPDAEGESK